MAPNWLLTSFGFGYSGVKMFNQESGAFAFQATWNQSGYLRDRLR